MCCKVRLVPVPFRFYNKNNVEKYSIQKCVMKHNINFFNKIAIGLFMYMISTVDCHSEAIKNEEECKIADLCVHDKVPMCGIDSCGEMRTFIDTCDMHEFNCDSKKDFKNRPIHECWVTCKRGRSFKKPEFRTDCNINVKNNRI